MNVYIILSYNINEMTMNLIGMLSMNMLNSEPFTNDVTCRLMVNQQRITYCLLYEYDKLQNHVSAYIVMYINPFTIVLFSRIIEVKCFM